MMTVKKFVLGDDIGIKATLKVGTSAADVSSATSIKAAFVYNNTKYLEITLANDDSYTDKTGTVNSADWANGVIVITYTSAQTRTLTANGTYYLEVTVNKSGITTWHIGAFDSYFKAIQDYIDVT